MNSSLFSVCRRRSGGVLLAGVLLVGACDDSPTRPASSDDALALADAMFGSAGGLQLATVPGTINVDREAACPEGGKRAQRGTASMTVDGEEREITWDFTLRHDDCALRIHDEVIVTDGTMQHTGTQRIRLPASAGGRPTLLAYEARQHGTATTTFRGNSRTCELDLTQRFDAATRTMHLTGTSCGHTIDFRRSVDL